VTARTSAPLRAAPPVIEIRHFRPGFGTCGAGGGGYSSMYLHVSAWMVSPGELVGKGD